MSEYNFVKATVIADSITEEGKRITSFEIECPRFIWAEVMTHKIISKNAASSRAIPVLKKIKMIWNNPVKPVYWGKNKAGMQSEGVLEGWKLNVAKATWNVASKTACTAAYLLSKVGLHKQWAGRLLEAFEPFKAVLTATEWENFFYLRDESQAQPEIQLLAQALKEARSKSVPNVLRAGQWHLPYVTTVVVDEKAFYFVNGRHVDVETAIKVSVSLCAQVSYRLQNDSIEKAIEIYDRLITSTPPHCFDDKTEVLTAEGFKFWKNVTENDLLASVDKEDGKFIGYNKPNELIAKYYDGVMYNYEQADFSLSVTPNHKMFGVRHNSVEKRKSVNYELFEVGAKSSNRSRYATNGECEFKNALTTNGVKNEGDLRDYYLGQLYGFFVGDGFVPKDGSVSVLAFNLKRGRKIEFLRGLSSNLGMEYSEKISSGVHRIKLKKQDIGKLFKEELYTEDGDKKLPYWWNTQSQSFLNGLFDGLKNSDGSVKRKTMVYSTSSETLKDQFLELCAIGGFGSCFVDTSQKENRKLNYRIMVRTKKYALVNDSRRPSARVSIEQYSGMVYCANVPGNVLIVRRNGNVSLSGNCSPSEHLGTPVVKTGKITAPDTWQEGVTAYHKVLGYMSGNLAGWVQQRQLLTDHTKW